MAGDKFDQLYNALKADGAVSGTREHFRQFVYAPGKQGYHNRKQLYDALHADGAVSSNSYEEFAQRLGLHAVNPKPQQQKPVQPVKKQTMKQRAQEVAAQYQKSRQQKAQHSGTDYMKNWRLMHMRNDQMNPMQQAQASNARARMQRAQEQAIQQEQRNPIAQSRVDLNPMKEVNRRFRDMAAKGALAYSSRTEREKMYDIANANNRSLHENSPLSENFNEMMQRLDTPDARRARAKQQREDDARALAQYEVEGNKFVRNDGKTEGILGNDLLNLVDSSMNEAQELTRQQYQQNLDKMGGIYAPQSVKEQAFRDAQTQEQVNRQNVLMNNLSKKIGEIYSQKGMQRHIAESAERLNMGVEEYVDKYVTPEIINYAQKALTMRNQEEIMPHGALDYIAKNLSNSIIGMMVAPSVMSRDTRQRLQEGIAIADGDAEIQKVAGHKDETYRSGIGTRFASTAVNMAADSGPLAVIGAGASAAVNTGTRVLTNGLVKAGVMKAAQKLTAQQMAFKVANMTTAQKIMSGLGTRTATSSLNLAGYSGVTAALSQASTGDDTSLQAIGEAGLKGAEHGAVTGAMFGVSGAVMAPWVSKFGITGLEKSTGERLLHGAQKFGATAAGLGVEAGTMMVADNVTGDKDISFGTWLEDVVMVGAFKAGEPSNFVKMGNILHHLTHNSGGNFVIGKNANGSPIAVDIRLTPDEKNELISSASGKNLMDAFVKVDRASKTAPRDPKYKTAYTDFMNDPDVSQSTKEKVNAAMGLFNTTRGRSYRSVNDVKNKQVLEYTKNNTLLTRTSYKNADERRAILYKQKLYRDNDDMMSLMGYARMKDMQFIDDDGTVTNLAFRFLKENGYDENKDITDPNNARLINELRNQKSALYLDWEKYAEKNGLLGYLRSESKGYTNNFMASIKELLGKEGSIVIDIDKIMRKDPMKRTDEENRIFYHVKRALEDELFPSWRPHADQSASQGKTVAEENKLGTDNPDGGVVVDELRNLHNAEQAVDEAMESNDVFKQTFEKLHQQGLTPAQIYDALIQNGLTEEELTPLAQYINANARVQGMQQATADAIEENVKSFISDWSYHGTLNGQAMNGEQALYVQDSNGRTLLVGSGDVAFDQTTGRAKEGSGDMLVCFDPNTREMVYVKADEVTLFQNQPIDQFAAEYRQRLQMKNSEPYNQAAQEQAMQDAAKPQQEQEAPQDNTTKPEDSTTKEGDLTKDNTTSGKDNTTNEDLVPQEQPQPTRKFADGSDVPMVKDSKGRPTPNYEKMTPEQSAEILTEDFGENAEKVVDGQIQKAEKALKDAEKMKVDYTAEPNDIMEQETLKNQTIEAAKKQLDHARNIKKAMTAKKVAETVGNTEQTEGAHEAGSVAAQKFVNAPRLVGNKRTRMLPDGETKIKGHYEIVPAESLTPSHDVNNGYKKTEGFPTDAEGRTVNDRDYEHDKAAQQNTDQIARKYNGMAIEQVPVVSDEGIVYDGNGRTMAGQKAAKEGTDGEYINDLLENAENFGFTREQIEQSGIEHPRLVLVTDERLPYDAATFSKFNRNEKKTQSNTEQAVAKAKTLTSDEVGAIVAEIEGNGSLDAFFNNSKAINDLVKTLVDKGIIGQNEVAQMMDSPERLSAQGREYVKNLLLGSIFKPETIRMLGIDSTVKNKAINAIRSVMDNMKLGEFSLRDEIDQAIQLLYEARQGGNKVDTLLRTSEMFGEDAAKRYSSISQMMALALEGKVSDFRDLLDEYNRIAAARNTGEGSIFEAAPTKEELVKEFLDFKKWQDYGTGHSENEGGNDVSGDEEPQQEASGGNEPAEAGTEPERPRVEEPDDLVNKELESRIKVTDEETETPSKYGPIMKQKIVIDGDKEVMKVDEPNKKGEYTGSYYEYDGKKFGDLNEVTEYIDSKDEEGPLPLLPKEENPDPQFNPIEAAAAEFKKEHPLTEDEIMKADVDDLSKDMALDYLNGEVTDDLHRAIYESIYVKTRGQKAEPKVETPKAEPSADPMEGIKNAAEAFEKEKKTKAETEKKPQQTADDAAVAASNKKVNDLWDMLKNAGNYELSASFVGLNSRQLEVLPKLVSAMAENAYLRIKRGMHNLEDVVKEMRKEFAPAAKVFKKEDVDAIYEQMMNIRYRDGEQRMSLKEWADYYEKTSPKHQENLVGDSMTAEERKMAEKKFIDTVNIKLVFKHKFNGIVELRQIAERVGLKDIKDTDLQELAETAIVKRARGIASSESTNNAEKFKRIKALYENQPSLNQRDSERVMKQQYSTPAPYAFVADMYVKGNGKVINSALEPSAGNGMLTIGLPKDKVHVNDIDDARLLNLNRQGFGKVTSQDGTQPFNVKPVDIVITNPPFGNATPKDYDGYNISSLEGQMAINALDSMKGDGRAAIIIGGNTEYAKNGSLRPKDKAFLGYLYSHYNVEDVINVDGSLFAKQGTTFPTRMILINGRRLNENAFPPVKDKARAETVKDYDELYKRIEDDILRGERMDSSIGGETRSAQPELDQQGAAGAPKEGVRAGERGGSEPDASDGSQRLSDSSSVSGTHDDLENRRGTKSGKDGGLPDGDSRADGTGTNVARSDGAGNNSNPEGRVLESRGNGQSNTQLHDNESSVPGSGGGSRRQLQRLDQPVRGLSTEKVTYSPKSENPFTLKAVMPADQQEAVNKNLEKLGDADQFLVDELGYNDKDDLYSHLAAEQVDSVALALQQAKKGKAKGGKYFLDKDLLKLVNGNNFETRGNNMLAEFKPEQLKPVLDRLSKMGVKVQEEHKTSEDEGTHFREDRGLQYSKTDTKDVKNSRIIPEDVDKTVSSQIEKKFDSTIKDIKEHTEDRDKSLFADNLESALDEFSNFGRSVIEYYKNDYERKVEKLSKLSNGGRSSGEIDGNGNKGSYLLQYYKTVLAVADRELAYRDARAKNLRETWGLQPGGAFTLGAVERIFKETNRDKAKAELFQKALDISKRLGVTFKVSEENPSRASGEAGINRNINLYIDGLTKTKAPSNSAPNVMLHEMIHEATMGAINLVKKGKAEGMLTPKQIEGVKTILEIYDRVKGDKERFKEEPYGLTDTYELTAQMADSRQRKAMDLSIWDRVMNAAHEFARRGDRSILQRVKDAIKKLFEVSDKDKMDKAINDIMDDFNETIDDISMNEIEQDGFSYKVTDKDELDRLNKEKTFRMYSGMQEVDGKLYSPMAAIIDGKRTDATEIGAWMGADERPDLVKNGKFQLVKTDKNPGAGEGPVPAAYNPYMHTSTSVMNDQFSGAYARGNIKVVEWEIPESEKTSGYHAKGAKNSVGLVPWTSGTVNSLLPKDRQRSVMLSRWRKAVRILPDEEVAEKIADQLRGTGLAIPWNVVTPNQLRELVKLGVPITTVEQGIQNPETKEKFLKQMAELEQEFPQAKFVNVKMTKDAHKEWGKNGGTKFRTDHGDGNYPTSSVESHVEKVAQNTGGKVKMVSSVGEITNKAARAAIEEGRKITGWYDEKTGEVHLYMPNIHDRYTAEKTIWHEVVGHKGMRELFGDERFDKFLRDVWYDLDKPENAALKKLVDEERKYNPLNIYDAIEEGIARLAEDGKGEAGFWNGIKNKVSDFLHEIGYRIAPNTKDVKYLLWLAKNYSKHPESDGYFAIRRNALLHKLERDNTPSIVDRNGMYFDNDGKNHDYLLDLNRKDFEQATDGQVHFRTSPMTASKIEEYDKVLGTKLYAFKESTLNHLQALEEAMKLESGEKDVWKDIPSAFNPLQAANRMDSVCQKISAKYDSDITEPLAASFKRMVSVMDGKNKDEQKRNAELYMITKHGLERNRVLYVRDTIRDLQKDETTKVDADRLQRDWNATFKDLGDKLDDGTVRFDQFIEKMDEWIRHNIDADYDSEAHDYSGLTAIKKERGKDDPDYSCIDDVMSTESKMGKELVEEFWKNKAAATDFIIDQEYHNGFKDSAERNHLKSMFKFYIPLRKFDETTAEDIYGYITEKGNPNNYIGSVIANAKGRESLSDVNVLAQISAMAKTSILNGGKNVVKQHLLRFVQTYESGNNENRIFLEINPWVEKHIIDGNEVWEEVTPQIPENATQEQISNIVQNFESSMQAKKENGEAKLYNRRGSLGVRFQRAKDKNQHIVEVYVAGKKRLLFCQGNPRAAQAVNGLIKDSGASKTWAAKNSAKINRFCAQANTSYNIDFMFSNLTRDLTVASANVTKEGPKYTKDFCTEYLNNLTSFRKGKEGNYWSMFSRYRKNKLDMNNDRERMFKEFMDNGGQTGFTEIKKLEDMMKEYDNLIKKGNMKGDNKVLAAMKNGLNYIEVANELFENIARYSCYVTSRKAGRSVGRSIYDAKEVSGNFNKHGSGDAIKSLKTANDNKGDVVFRNALGWFNSYMKNYTMFYNAGVQGASIFARNFKRNAAGMSMVFGVIPFALGIAQALINQYRISNEDEKERGGVKDPYAELPEWKRRNNICIYWGKGNFKTIPIGIELRAFFGLGDIVMGQSIYPGLKSDTPVGCDILGQMAQLVPASDFLGHHSPFGGTAESFTDLGLAAAPTALKPELELIANRDWTGRPIYRGSDYLDYAPRWKRAYDSTSDVFIDINKWANMTFNDFPDPTEDMKGNDAADFITAPYIYQHLLEGYFGGAGSTVSRIAKTGYKAVTGNFDEIDPNQIPLYRVFNYKPSEGHDMQRTKSKWYNYSDELKQTEYNINQLKTNTPDVLKNIENNAKKFNFTHGKEGKAYNIWNAADSYIQKKKRQLKKVSDPEVIKAINEDINRKMQEAVNDLDKLN